MPFNQDDARERAMVSALNLQQDAGRARHDADAFTEVEVAGVRQRIEFECKSAPIKKDFGTGRDTGLKKLQEWADMHFVFAWFEPRDNQPVKMWYGSPRMMRKWNVGEQAYLALDLKLVRRAPTALGQSTIEEILGEDTVFTYDQINAIVKNQWNANRASGRPNLYQAKADVVRSRRRADLRYSREVAEEAVRDRVRYLLERGSTVNNRKISSAYVSANCVELRPPGWAAALERELTQALTIGP